MCFPYSIYPIPPVSSVATVPSVSDAWKSRYIAGDYLPSMKISVIGAGALGTFYAAAMAASGQDVTLVCRERDLPVLRNGISATGSLEVIAHPAVSARPVLSDVVFVTVKAYDVPGAVRDIPLGSDTIVVIIHNGLGADEAAAAILGQDRVAIGLAYRGAFLLEPGKVRVSGYGETVLGAVDPVARSRLGLPLQALIQAGLDARILEDIRGAQWEKLYVNVGANAISAITQMSNGEIVELPGLTAVLEAAIREAEAIAHHIGIRTGGDPVAHTLAVMRDAAGNRTSMLQDVSRGRRTEIDALNGKICELGRVHGVPTPVNDTLTALVKGIEKRGGR